ncbi:hypothetical protein [Ketobacter sp.]|uniref:hypothetical protein n=1 Tax=Ketobacter sp. TaxID=2083498 RepID=UPI000F245250|nr:hypothetical protein [Ketobacter sp.]RLU01212.1 MAG: hypothetical protein D9N14_03375 [Ketobacter sp.]
MSEALTDQLIKSEYSALKAEMLLRIAIQNLVILVAIVLFVPSALLIVTAPQYASVLALIYVAANLALALQWCHQGVRQCALKQAILACDQAAGRDSSWETWLPTQRPASMLGSRWFISTKLVFIGLSAAAIVLAIKCFDVVLLCSAIVFFITVAVLLTNPKE